MIAGPGMRDFLFILLLFLPGKLQSLAGNGNEKGNEHLPHIRWSIFRSSVQGGYFWRPEGASYFLAGGTIQFYLFQKRFFQPSSSSRFTQLTALELAGGFLEYQIPFRGWIGLTPLRVENAWVNLQFSFPVFLLDFPGVDDTSSLPRLEGIWLWERNWKLIQARDLLEAYIILALAIYLPVFLLFGDILAASGSREMYFMLHVGFQRFRLPLATPITPYLRFWFPVRPAWSPGVEFGIQAVKTF